MTVKNKATHRAAPKSLYEFQKDFGLHLRNPKSKTLPKKIPKRRSNVYEDLLFNNICGFVDKCFPVTRNIINPKTWSYLCRLFFINWRCTDPIFARIPFEFIQFINQTEFKKPLPAWLPELLHYEWIELEVDMDRAGETPSHISNADISRLQTNGTLKVLSYQWPVHKISPSYKPRKQQQFCTLVFRDLAHQVKFIEVNPLTAYLVQQIQLKPANKMALLGDIAEQLQWPDKENFIQLGCNIINDLSNQGALFDV